MPSSVQMSSPAMMTLAYFEVHLAGLSSTRPSRCMPAGSAHMASSKLRLQSSVRPTSFTGFWFQKTRLQACATPGRAAAEPTPMREASAWRRER